ncbi:MAG: o-succinylbenzoate synthase [Actinomycetota bacterium]
MRLAAFELFRYSLPLTEPLILKSAALREREGVLLRLIGEDGREGWGEASPLPGFSRESTEEATEQLRDLAARSLEDRVLPGWEAGTTARLCPSARFAFELAALGLLAGASEKRLSELLSPRPREAVPVNALLSGDPERVLADAAHLRAEGYGAFKLKVGAREVGEDAALVRELGGMLGGAALRLDANRAWDLEEGREFARAVSGTRIEYVEEPLSDPGLLPGLARETGLPVALDESLAGLEPEDLRAHRYARAVVLKPTLIGGISRALRFARAALEAGLTPVVSSAYETGIGTSALVALAAAVGEEPVPAGLDTYRRLAGDVIHPRLDLAPTVDVRAACAPREIAWHRLEPVGGAAA